MSNILRLCPKCQINPATIQCIDCEEKMCYSCDQKIKSTQFIISGIKDHSNISYELQKELNELEAIIEAKQSFLIKQEEKWSTQINTLESQYEKKLKEFEKEIDSNENQFKNYQSGGNTTSMIADIKQQMEAQKQQARKQLNDRKVKLQDKEALQLKQQINLIILKDMISTEQFCQNEISSKEKLINQFKDLLQQQQAERDLIIGENQKILKQLESIKALCKKSLPEFGINIDFLDKLGRLNKVQNNEQVEQQDKDKEQDNAEKNEEQQNDKPNIKNNIEQQQELQ